MTTTTKEQDAALCDRNADSCRDSPHVEERQYEAAWRMRAAELRQPATGGLQQAKECIDAALFEIGDRNHELPEWFQDIWQRRVLFITGIEEKGNG